MMLLKIVCLKILYMDRLFFLLTLLLCLFITAKDGHSDQSDIAPALAHDAKLIIAKFGERELAMRQASCQATFTTTKNSLANALGVTHDITVSPPGDAANLIKASFFKGFSSEGSIKWLMSNLDERFDVNSTQWNDSRREGASRPNKAENYYSNGSYIVYKPAVNMARYETHGLIAGEDLPSRPSELFFLKKDDKWISNYLEDLVNNSKMDHVSLDKSDKEHTQLAFDDSSDSMHPVSWQILFDDQMHSWPISVIEASGKDVLTYEYSEFTQKDGFYYPQVIAYTHQIKLEKSDKLALLQKSVIRITDMKVDTKSDAKDFDIVNKPGVYFSDPLDGK